MVLLGLLMFASGFWLVLAGPGGAWSFVRLVGVLVGVQGLFQVPIGLYLVVRGREAGDIELQGGRLLAFAHPLAVRRSEVDLAAVRSLMLQSSRRGEGRLFVGTDQAALVIESDELARPDELPRLALALRESLRSLPDGEARLRALDRQLEVTRAIGAQRPWATWAILATLGFAFLLQYREGALVDPIAMLRLGAGSSTFVAEGEWFRLVSANFLHAIDAHLVINGLGLVILGGLLERLLGPWRFLIVYFISALGGALASMIWSAAPLMMGASTAVFGLVGALLVTERVLRWQLPPMARQSIRSLALVVVLNVGLGFVVPFIDQAAHLGGFAAGLVAGYALLPRDRQYRPLDPGGLPTWLVAVGLALLFGAGLVAAAHNARDFKEEAALRTILEHEATDPATLNNMAWSVVIRPAPTPALLGTALELVERALADAPDEPAFLDTRAGALHRLGRPSEALADARRAFAGRPGPVYAAHLARILEGFPPVLDTAVVPVPPYGAEVRGGPSGSITVLGTWTLGRTGGVFVGRVERAGLEAVTSSPENMGLFLLENAELEIRWAGPSLPDEVKQLAAGTYQAWPDVGVGELPPFR